MLLGLFINCCRILGGRAFRRLAKVWFVHCYLIVLDMLGKDRGQAKASTILRYAIVEGGYFFSFLLGLISFFFEPAVAVFYPLSSVLGALFWGSFLFFV